MRNRERVVVQLGLITLGLVCVFACKDMVVTGKGMRDGIGIPMPWIGYGIIGYSALGFFGVNIFKGGPLDRHRDPPAPEPDHETGVDGNNRPRGPRRL